MVSVTGLTERKPRCLQAGISTMASEKADLGCIRHCPRKPKSSSSSHAQSHTQFIHSIQFLSDLPWTCFSGRQRGARGSRHLHPAYPQMPPPGIIWTKDAKGPIGGTGRASRALDASLMSPDCAERSRRRFRSSRLGGSSTKTCTCHAASFRALHAAGQRPRPQSAPASFWPPCAASRGTSRCGLGRSGWRGANTIAAEHQRSGLCHVSDFMGTGPKWFAIKVHGDNITSPFWAC